MGGRKRFGGYPDDVRETAGEAADNVTDIFSDDEREADDTPGGLLPGGLPGASGHDAEAEARLKFFREMSGGEDSVGGGDRGQRFHFDAASALKDFRRKNPSGRTDGADAFAAYGKPPGAAELLPAGTENGHISGETDEAELKVFREIGAAMGEPGNHGNPGNSGDLGDPNSRSRLPVGISAAVRRFRETGVMTDETDMSGDSDVSGGAARDMDAMAALRVFRELSGVSPEADSSPVIEKVSPGSGGGTADVSALEAVRKLREKGGVIREDDVPEKSAAVSPVEGEALEFLKMFREMSGALEDIPGNEAVWNVTEGSPVEEEPAEGISPGEADGAEGSSVLEAVRKLREKGGVIREDDVPEKSAEVSPVEGEALEFLKMFREMSGAPEDIPGNETVENIPESSPGEDKPVEGISLVEADGGSALEAVRKLREKGGVIREDDVPEKSAEVSPVEGEALEFLKMFREMSGAPEGIPGNETAENVTEISPGEDKPAETAEIQVSPEMNSGSEVIGETENFPEADNEPEADGGRENVTEETEPEAQPEVKEPEKAPVSLDKSGTYELNISRKFGVPDLPEDMAEKAPGEPDDPVIFNISWDETQAARWKAYDPGKPEDKLISMPPITLDSIPLDEEILAQARQAQERETEKCSLAVCGADCTDCPFGEDTDCTGCGGLCEDCDIVRCCAVKGIKHCGVCEYFPCERLREAAFDPESGDNGERLVRLKELGEAEKSRKAPRILLAGVSGGVALGAAVGGFSGAFAPWLLAGAVVGAGLGAISVVASKGRKRGE